MIITTTPQVESRADEGIALVLALLFMLAFASVGAAVMVLARTETFSSLNYRLMSQARYGAEAGVHKAAHFLLYSYTLPQSAEVVNFNTAVSPVLLKTNSQPVVLSSMSDVTGNYPTQAQAQFAAATKGTLPVGQGTVEYTATATLVSMRTVTPFLSTTSTVVQTWRITARGRMAGTRSGQVEVSAILERQVVPAYRYAAFATNDGCGALRFNGVQTFSYFGGGGNSSNGNSPKKNAPTVSTKDGNVGTNGNLTAEGTTTINGTLSTPRTGVGTCTAGSVTAEDRASTAQLTGGLVALPQVVTFTAPQTTVALTTAQSVSDSTADACKPFTDLGAKCTDRLPKTSSDYRTITVSPGNTGVLTLGDVSISGNAVLKLGDGTYNVNSLKLFGTAQLDIRPSTTVTLNIAGTNQPVPLDLTGTSTVNDSYNAARFRINYAGTGELNLRGNAHLSAAVYAPSALVRIGGNSEFYGAVVGSQVIAEASANLNYDTALSVNQELLTLGPHMMSSFTWKAR